MASQWPAMPPILDQPIAESIYRLREYTRKVSAYAGDGKRQKVRVGQVKELCDTYDVLLSRIAEEMFLKSRSADTFQEQFRQAMESNQRTALIGMFPALPAPTPPPQPIQQSPDAPSPSLSSADVSKDRKDLFVKIRWDNCTSPYLSKSNSRVVKELQQLVNQGREGCKPIQLDAVRVHGSGDVETHAPTALDIDSLTETSPAWLPRRPHGVRARIIPNMFSIIIHGVPRKTFSRRSFETGQAKDIILQASAARIPDACIVHVSWTSGRFVLKAQKPKGSLIVEFHRAADANKLLREPFILNGTPLHTELYTQEGQVSQCHRSNCPHQKDPEKRYCANRGANHPANSKNCRFHIEAVTKSRRAVAQKPKYFEEPPESRQQASRSTPQALPPPQIATDSESATSNYSTTKKRGRPQKQQQGQQKKQRLITHPPTTPTPLIQGEGTGPTRKAVSTGRSSTLAHDITVDESEYHSTTSRVRSQDLQSTDDTASSQKSTDEALSGPEQSASEPELGQQLPSSPPHPSDAASQSAASDSDIPPVPSPHSSPRKRRRSARISESEPEQAPEPPSKKPRRSSGHRSPPLNQSPSKHPTQRAKWNGRRKAENKYRQAKNGLFGNRRTPQTPAQEQQLRDYIDGWEDAQKGKRAEGQTLDYSKGWKDSHHAANLAREHAAAELTQAAA
ncbi:hypothetical protein NUU61_005848 [Penicillium alfredii]|uniref:Uncharacterized protein n=1 Tax=Penicillium alfredii TaxID=1506179 RepID=A0A9W9FA70_9EURO|nr:uncharacterized protein NUU61_005848 [Penicillium alfredii]KAJ5096492.1 hypothetical protein NUU61_005848 [Penicillium alfredii]